MAGFPPITVRHPAANDLVGDPVDICGVATGFEGTITARLRDDNGTDLAEDPIQGGRQRLPPPRIFRAGRRNCCVPHEAAA